jgi:hypothetical protein
MYVQNTIGELDQEEYLKKLRSVLRRKYLKDVKPSELKQRVEDFKVGKNPKIDSLSPINDV